MTLLGEPLWVRLFTGAVFMALVWVVLRAVVALIDAKELSE